MHFIHGFTDNLHLYELLCSNVGLEQGGRKQHPHN